MVKKSVKEILFFVIMFLLYCVATNLNDAWEEYTKINHNVSMIVTGVVFVLIMVGIYFLANMNKSNSNEGFWDVTKFAQCRGGPYMWQGDSATAKMCRKLAETPEGRCGISSYNCPTGFNGTPKIPFYYTPLSNDNWENERCENIPDCQCKNNGLCSMDAQKPWNEINEQC